MNVTGRLTVPGDKSITHRALFLAALADGVSTIDGALVADDTRSTAGVLRKLGITISALRDGGPVRVTGAGRRGFRPPSGPLDCGNSGTTARLLTGLLAGLGIAAEVSGDESLRRRPMRRVTDPLREMGARVVERNGDGLPILLEGNELRPLHHAPSVASAQVKTALLLAGLAGGVGVTVVEPVPTRDHTERMLRALGVDLEVSGGTVRLAPAVRLQPFRVTVPGDASSAAFLAVAAVLADEGRVIVDGLGVNATRTGFVRVLQRMGASVLVEEETSSLGEPVGRLVAAASGLRGTVVEGGEVPSVIDEIPVLAVAASRARGTTAFHGVGELRAKESDRLALLAANLNALGVPAGVDGDTLTVTGVTGPLAGAVDTGNDHRLAMAFGVLAAHPDHRISLSEDRSPRISYPRFFDDLAALTAP